MPSSNTRQRSPFVVQQALVSEPRSAFPSLLVSVRSEHEARIAIAGGCDILDVKEPAHGSLGRASSAVWHAIASTVAQISPATVLTAAMGEVAELPSVFSETLPREFQLVKLGCAALGNARDWQDRWNNARHQLAANLPRTIGWVAVAYADQQLAAAPAPSDVIRAAMEEGCRGVLIDTFDKSRGRLLNWMNVDDLQQVAALVQQAGMFLALAGSLRPSDLPRLAAVPADIIAIRGAACPAGDRQADICQATIHEFRLAMEHAWANKGGSA